MVHQAGWGVSTRLVVPLIEICPLSSMARDYWYGVRSYPQNPLMVFWMIH